MNTQERDQLTRFLQQLNQAQVAHKDSEAEALIRESCIRQADAAYLLIQRAMLLENAVQDSQAQIARLQWELDQARSGNQSASFLGTNTWGNSALTKPAPPAQTPFFPATSVSTTAPTSAPVASAATSAWGSGMLGNVASTAAGVIAGGFLFQGIEHLLDRQGSNSGRMNGLSNEVSADRHDVTDINRTADERPDSAGVFDTSSIDDFIANDTDGIG
jgi:hypothetical protein